MLQKQVTFQSLNNFTFCFKILTMNSPNMKKNGFRNALSGPVIKLVVPCCHVRVNTKNFRQVPYQFLPSEVAYLTFLPVLGASAGAPNSNLETLAMIVLIGAIGGIFWSTPFAIWSHFKSRGNESISGMAGEEE